MRKLALLGFVILVISGCFPRMSFHEEMYRAGRIPLHMWQAWEQVERDVRDGKGRFPFGSENEVYMIREMLLERRR